MIAYLLLMKLYHNVQTDR